MTGGIRVPVCAIGEAARQAATGLTITVRNIRLISLHWQKAMAQRESVSQRQEKELCRLFYFESEYVIIYFIR